MESQNNYIIKWRNTVLSAASALESKDFNLYNELMGEADKIVELIKKDDSLTYECKNFGIINYIFENSLPVLFKKNRKAIGEFIRTIKEDKNLINQFQFFQALKKYNSSLDAKEYLNESLKILHDNVDVKTINESNKKLSKIIDRYSIKPSESISEENLKYFDSCDFLFKNRKKLTNLSSINEKFNNVMCHINNNSNNINENKSNMVDEITEYFEKLSFSLNENEKKFVKDIINSDISNKKIMFNNLKNECIGILSKTLNETTNTDEISELKSIKEQLSSKEFCLDTLIEDVVKFLDIKDVLLA